MNLAMDPLKVKCIIIKDVPSHSNSPLGKQSPDFPKHKSLEDKASSINPPLAIKIWMNNFVKFFAS